MFVCCIPSLRMTPFFTAEMGRAHLPHHTASFRPNVPLQAPGVQTWSSFLGTEKVLPRLKYCCAVWGRASPGLLSRLEKLQLQVAFAIARPSTPMSASQLLESLGLPTLAWRRRIRRLVILYKLTYGQGPSRLLGMLSKAASCRSMRLLLCLLLKFYCSRTASCAGISAWMMLT